VSKTNLNVFIHLKFFCNGFITERLIYFLCGLDETEHRWVLIFQHNKRTRKHTLWFTLSTHCFPFGAGTGHHFLLWPLNTWAPKECHYWGGLQFRWGWCDLCWYDGLRTLHTWLWGCVWGFDWRFIRGTFCLFCFSWIWDLLAFSSSIFFRFVRFQGHKCIIWIWKNKTRTKKRKERNTNCDTSYLHSIILYMRQFACWLPHQNQKRKLLVVSSLWVQVSLYCSFWSSSPSCLPQSLQ